MLHINLIWNPSVNSAPAGFVTAVQDAAQQIEQAFSDNITVNITVGWGEVGGSPITDSAVALGGPHSGIFETYSDLTTALMNDRTTADDYTAFASLPVSADPNGNGLIAIWNAEAKALGLMAANNPAIDGDIGFSTDFPSNDWVGAALHELTHAMGRISGEPFYGILDLYRYSAPGTFQWIGGQPAYFSIDGGNNVLAHFATTSDYGDWVSDSLTVHDPFNAFISDGSNSLTAVDLTVMDAIGFDHIVLPTTNDDILYATSGPDTINALAGNDTVHGLGGDDVLIGGPGNDTLDGGPGSDTADYSSATHAVTVNLGAGTASGGTEVGNDTLISIENAIGGVGNDHLTGSSGDNILNGGAGADQLSGGDGNDTLIIDSSDTVVDGGNGIDTVDLTGAGMVFNLAFGNLEIANGTSGNDQIDGSVGTIGPLTLNGFGGVDTLSGGSSGDTIDGGDGSDSLYGNAGADTITGGIGIDYIDGGADGDTIHGGDDNDTIYGGDGNDFIYGEGSNEYAFGGNGNDYLEGGVGTDYMVGDDNVIANTSITGTDTLVGGDDGDTLIGGYGSDSLSGDAGNDALYGDFDDVGDGLTGTDPGSADTLAAAPGNDFMFGGGGIDILTGGDDNDTLIGGSGNDTLTGGAGSDSLYGQAGTDTFVFGDGWGTDGLWDFADGSEILDLSAVTGLTSFGQLSITDQVSGALHYADVAFAGNHIFIVGVTAAQLTTADFVL